MVVESRPRLRVTLRSRTYVYPISRFGTLLSRLNSMFVKGL